MSYNSSPLSASLTNSYLFLFKYKIISGIFKLLNFALGCYSERVRELLINLIFTQIEKHITLQEMVFLHDWEYLVFPK
jgi:hypothetical protein